MYVAVEKGHKYLRRFLIQHKMFLWNLYQKSPLWCKRRIRRGTSAELRILIRFLVCLEKGHVEIRSKNYRHIVKSKRVNKLIQLREKKAFYLKKSTLEEKVNVLTQFCSLYRYLLEPLFYERKIKVSYTYFFWISRMDVVVKVLIDAKEYDRLLEIERKFKEVSDTPTSSTSQSGAGTLQNCSCAGSSKAEKYDTLDQIVTLNEEADAVKPPIPGVLPSITTTPSAEPSINNRQKESIKERKKTEKKGVNKTGSGDISEDHSEELEKLGIVKFVHPWYYIGAPHS